MKHSHKIKIAHMNGINTIGEYARYLRRLKYETKWNGLHNGLNDKIYRG